MRLEDFLLTVQLPWRGDCVVCGNTNTLSADRDGRDIVFNCFHANCRVHGRLKNVSVPIEAFRDFRTGNSSNSSSSDGDGFSQPVYWLAPTSDSRCFGFMLRWALDRLYMDGRIGLKYDPKRERCVFILRTHRDEEQGAVGRALSKKGPKWYVYQRNNGCPGFVKNKHTTRLEKNTRRLLLVEDMISAAKGSEVIDTAAILGTSISTETIKHLLPYKELLIALDSDATGKAVALQHQLSFYRKTRIIPLQNDIKYYTKKEIENAIA